ncbi:AAA family ATPase [Photobacterium carnosum]|uniref:AAA family ATPase n=1 Tax=Photobacterium carnosum TaxID=2023717 RepID=UPI001E4AB932|nr:AAA family ATPase [Photobacterium carnosum]MCD9500480.1 AAA family ATPase [Photobacterium carnosum]
MQLKEVRISQLFGHFNHVVKLNNDEKITIITAPNGYGKTMILKTLNYIFNGKTLLLKHIEFDVITLIFDDKFLSIKKDDSGLAIKLYRGYPSENSEQEELKFFFYNDDSDVSTPISKLSSIDELLPHLDRVNRMEWLDTSTDDILSLGMILDRYPEINDFLQIERKALPKWFSEITEGINVHFVQDQRLIQRFEMIDFDRFRKHRPGMRGNNRRTIDTIEKYSSELSAFISKYNEKYSEVSKQLDSSLPARLLSKTKKIEIYNQETLKIKLDDISKKNERLKKHTLLKSNFLFIPAIEGISSEDIKVLSLYVQDNTQKLSVYDDILSKIELFTDILNNKGLAFKKIVVNQDEGFFFVNDSDKTLKLTQLSSGEQHEVVLVYELIFKAKDNDLVLIDEPEISLHIAWQKEFLEDIKRIIDIQNVSIIIATHSPQIIDNNWDLTVDLGEE